MKKVLLVFALSVWEIICFSSIIINIKRYSFADHIVMLFMMLIPIGAIYISKQVKIRRYQKIKMEEAEEIKKLESGLPVIDGSSLILTDEVLHYYRPATLLITSNKAIGQAGSSRGFGYELIDGVYVGRSKSRSEVIYGDVTTPFSGQLAVTNKKVLFINQQKGFDIKVSDISLIEPYANGVSIQGNNNVYTMILKDPQYFIAIVKIIIKQNNNLV